MRNIDCDDNQDGHRPELSNMRLAPNGRLASNCVYCGERIENIATWNWASNQKD